MKPLADGRQAGTAVLVFAPVGRDAALTREFLGRASIPNLVCASMTQLCDIFEADGGGVLLLTEEALDDPVFPHLTVLLEGQASWSDVPVLVFAGGSGAETPLLAGPPGDEHELRPGG